VSLLKFFRLAIYLGVIFTPFVFAEEQQTPPTSLAKELGWIIDSASPNCCFGYYYDPFVKIKLMPLEDAPVTVAADGGVFRQQGGSVLTGHVVISQPGREITATTATLNRDTEKASNQEESVSLEGNVTVREPGKFILAKTGIVDLKTKIIRMQEAYYRIAFGRQFESEKITGTVAWGKASSFERQADNIFNLKNASYTTCSPLNPTWVLRSESISLNPNVGRGVAKNVILDVKNIPIFYFPYFDFPLDRRRQSGFLFPTIGTSNQQGFSFIQPYYWNIAPNYDDTITPAFYGNRGVQLRNDFRYLTTGSRGEFYFAFLPNDTEFDEFKAQAPSNYANSPSRASLQALESASNNRFGLSFQHETRFDDHWNADINYNYVNDDYYLQDFGFMKGVVTPNQLLREGEIVYQGEIWNFKGLLQNYLTLHPVNETPTQNQYSRMPELDLTGDFPTRKSQLNFNWDSQFVHFREDTNPGATLSSPTGERLNLVPAFDIPFVSIGGYFIPSVQYEFTQYVINGEVAANGEIFTPNTINRELPIIDVDSGMYFEKSMKFKNKKYTQTLEPRLFYLYVPYKNQNDIPEFDTSLQPFGYNQLFLTNRFSGIDRIGDANQLSLGMTSRLLDKSSNQERISFSLGEVFYFQDRKVTLCTAPGCHDIDSSPGATSATASISPLAGLVTVALTPSWKINGGIAWGFANYKTNNAELGLSYHGVNNRVFNIGYNFLTLGDEIQTNPSTPSSSAINNLNQALVSFAWPIKERWRIFTSLTYNISHVHAQNYLYGFEYSSCCWAVRMVAGRVFQSLNQNNNPVFNNSVFLQVQLKGLGNFGTSDPGSFLSNNIAGYHDNFGKTV